MFEIPEAKRVRREDLNESAVSGDSDSEADAQIRAQLDAHVARSLGLDLEDGPKQQQAIAPSSHKAAGFSRKTEDVEMEDGEGERAGPEEYDFCLFGGAGAAPTKVVLEDDSEPQGEGAIVEQRPASFYLAKDLSEEQRQRFKAAAVTGDEVLARSQSRWWGMELPWKVTHITTTTKKKKKKKTGPGQKVTTTSTSLESTESKRKHPGKKRRIALRMKERAEKDKMKTAAQLKEEKEEHLKEKKKRLNRLKKLKRREKEKEKKQAAAKGGQGAADSGSDSDGSS